ncbi:MAG: C4-type zinc ribbon domain-containing protein [Micrococcales bacterium]|nr:C4-type zinc ribbon domain-containing protein [Micrococcales bacterium]
MAKAPAEHQARLLAVQALDTRVQQANHRKARLPQAARLAEIRESLAAAQEAAADAQAAAGDVRRELTRAEDEVEKVKTRQVRDQERLDTGSSQAKELRALQSELEALARRRSDLEDVQLEIMERAEETQKLLAQAQGTMAELAAEEEALSREVDEVFAQIDAEVAEICAERQAKAEGLDERLMTLYERLRPSHGGVGAAELVARRCNGCRLDLTAADIAAIRAAAPDDVIRCEECGRILVLTSASGL